jgi:hypothetical protein
MRYIGALTIVAILSACSPSSGWYDMRLLNDQVTGMVHDCVPLGWVPVRVDDNVFYPGYSVEIDETDWYLPPPWVGGFGPHPVMGTQGRIAKGLLSHLVRAGMVSTRDVRGYVQYHLTESGFERYFDGDNFGNNRLHSSYVCYSKIVARSIEWKQPVHLEADPFGPGRVPVFRVAFTWSTAHDPSWTPDAFIRAHTIVLGPPKSPTLAKFILRGDFWELVNLYPGQPNQFVDPGAWPSGIPPANSRGS